MERGKIYKVDKSSIDIEGYDHYFVFLYNHRDYDTFIGIMLTRSRQYKGNHPLQKHHIKTHDNQGRRYEFQFDNSMFANQLLIKDSSLPINGPFGEITSEGLQYIERITRDLSEITWEEAKERLLELD